MAYEIGEAHKLGKQNINQFYTTTEPCSETSTPSFVYNELNEYTDIIHLKTFTTETHSIKICALDDKPSIVIHK